MTKIYYFAPFCFEKFNQIFNTSVIVGAAANKIKGISSAIMKAGGSVIIVSSPITTRSKKFNTTLAYYFESGIKVISLPTISIKFINRLYASYRYTIFSLYNIKRTDRVIFYNFFIEYIFAIIILRIKRVEIIIDIEDAPIFKDFSLRGLTNIASYFLIRLLTKKKYLVASNFIAVLLNLKSYICVYGVAQIYGGYEKNNKSRLRISYGGALIQETGVDIFCETIKDIYFSEFRDRYCFVVSGFGEIYKIIKIAQEINDLNFIELHFNETFTSYKKTLNTCEVGLCLKLPNTQIGKTTFPSKVIEIAANGLLLVTTNVSDVPLIFNNTNAVIIEKLNKIELVNALNKITSNRDEYKKVAKLGSDYVINNMSDIIIGKKILRYLEVN